LSAALAACEQLDTSKRTIDPYGTFGEIVYRESCQRVAYTGQLAQQQAGQRQTVDVAGNYGRAVCVDGNAPPADAPAKLSAIVAQKAALVATVDAILPKPFLTNLEHFLEQLLPLSDDGTMEKAISSLGNVLGTMAADPDFSPALSRLALRVGYHPTKTAAGLMRTIVNYPNIDQFLDKTLKMIAPGGTAEVEWKQLLTASSMALRSVQPVANVGDPERTLKLALNLMTSTHPDLGTGTQRPLVVRDYRGLATAGVDAKGQVLAPFVDVNQDGLADTDAQGRFVDAKGNLITVPSPFPDVGVTDKAPRDNQGRALTAPGVTTTLYKYLDLDGTVIGGLAREALTLMDPKKDTTLGLLWGTSALMGPRATKTEMYMDPMGGMLGALTYSGFDVTQSPLLDLVHAFVQIFDDQNADQTLQVAYALLNQYESQASRLIGAMLDASDTAKKYPTAQVPPTSNLYDDLMVIVNRILAVDGLAEDLMNALDPANSTTGFADIKDFAPMVARMMQEKNGIDFSRTGPDYPLLQAGADLDTVVPVDRTQPDADDNRSLMQRIAHIIHDSNGVLHQLPDGTKYSMCNKDGATVNLSIFGISIKVAGPYAPCTLFNIEDLGLFFALNMASQNARDINATNGHNTATPGADFCAHLKVKGGITDLAGATIIAACHESLGKALGIEKLSGVNGFQQFPTPHALTRILLLERGKGYNTFLDDTTDDARDSDGDFFKDVHQKTLVAWEAHLLNAPSGRTDPNNPATFYTAVQPIIDAFVKHDECIARDPNTQLCTSYQNAVKIFLDLFAMLHTHWTSPKGSYYGHTYQSTDPKAPRYSAPDNLVSYEPVLVDVLGQGDLVPAVLDIAPLINGKITVDAGGPNPLPARPFLISSVKYLFQYGAAKGIAYRNGSTTAVRSDGTTPVLDLDGKPTLTPYYLMADAFAHKRAALAKTDPAQSAAWKSATSALIDQLMTVKKNTDGTFQFSNRRFRALSLIMVNFVRGRIAAHAKTGDLDTWAHQTLTQDLTDRVSGPTFAALADFITKVENDPECGMPPPSTCGRTELYNLLGYLVNEAGNDLTFQTALTTLADQAQMFLDDPDLVPVAHVLGAAMDPTSGAVDAQLTLMHRAHDLDDNKALLTILRNLYQQGSDGVYPASSLADVLSELNRAQPGHGGDLSGDDYRQILNETKDFLGDQQRGFTRFINIVKARGPH
jgi:hypothetical protein